jgi:DNA polymerase-3 subunit beta
MTTDTFAGIEPPAGVNYGKFGFSVKQFVLLSLAESVSHAVPSREVIPVLGCFRLTLTASALELTATDNEQSARAVTTAFASALADEESYVFYLPARKLLSILRESPAGDFNVSVAGNEAVLTASGGMKWVLRMPPPDSYPVLGELGSLEFHSFDRGLLTSSLRMVRHAICKDAAQPSLTQVAVTGSGEDAVVTASDRTRLARAPLPNFPFPMTIPAGVLDDLLRLLAGHEEATVEVAETESTIVFRAAHVTLSAGKRTTQFPDMDKQLLEPALAANVQKLSVDKAELAQAVKRVSINADTQTSAIGLRLSQSGLAVEARDKAGNSAAQTVMADWQGKERLVVVNGTFLAEMLAASPAKSCEFRLGPDVGKKLSPILLVNPGGSVQVLTRMPQALLGY